MKNKAYLFLLILGAVVLVVSVWCRYKTHIEQELYYLPWWG